MSTTASSELEAAPQVPELTAVHGTDTWLLVHCDQCPSLAWIPVEVARAGAFLCKACRQTSPAEVRRRLRA